MADRTSAGIFGQLFGWLSEQGEQVSREDVAQQLWVMSQFYDFDPCQMDCFYELVELGYAEAVTEDGEEVDWLYGPEGARE